MLMTSIFPIISLFDLLVAKATKIFIGFPYNVYSSMLQMRYGQGQPAEIELVKDAHGWTDESEA